AAVEQFKIAGRRFGEGELLSGRGDLRRATLRFAGARTSAAQCTTMFIEAKDKPGEARVHIGIAELERLIGNLNEARSQYEKGRALGRSASDTVIEAEALKGLGHIERQGGNARTAHEMMRGAY